MVDALSGSLHSLLLVIITKHVLIIVSLFGMHLWLYILHWGGACILTLCLHPKSSVQLKPLLLPLYLLYLLTLWLLTLPLPFATPLLLRQLPDSRGSCMINTPSSKCITITSNATNATLRLLRVLSLRDSCHMPLHRLLS